MILTPNSFYILYPLCIRLRFSRFSAPLAAKTQAGTKIFVILELHDSRNTAGELLAAQAVAALC
jgi:hypothetical protein